MITELDRCPRKVLSMSISPSPLTLWTALLR